MSLRKRSNIPKQLRHWCKKAGFISENDFTFELCGVKRHFRKSSRHDYTFIHKKSLRRIRFLFHLEKNFSEGKECTWEPNRTDISCAPDDFDRWANSVEASIPRVPKSEKECLEIISRLLQRGDV